MANEPSPHGKQHPQSSGEILPHDVVVEESTMAQLDSMSEGSRLAEETRQANERALRAQAELENFRKRMRREMDDERRYAAMPLVSDFVSAVDNLDRAIEVAEKNMPGDPLLDGVKMVRTQILDVLGRHHCRRLGEVGEVFDPNRHKAIKVEPSDKYGDGVITYVARYGYQLHDRVVRPAEVLVSSGPPK
jgi:molecular chaperone GrpE